MLAGLDDETRQLLARAESQHDRSADETAVTAAPTESGTWLFNDADFGDALPDAPATLKSKADAPTEVVTQISPRQLPPAEADSSSTAQLKSLDPDELDLDLSDLRQRDPTHESNGLDLDVGPPATEGTFVQTQRIMAEDVALPDLEPATMSEVGTKLDLARAYMDMGDPEGARSILSEVLLEGSVSQKQEARRLIDTLPG
jgi:pilus assembly protein FimV